MDCEQKEDNGGRITGVLDFVNCPEFQKLEKTFQKLDLFPVSEMLCFLVFRG
jgi:hypothetical protein